MPAFFNDDMLKQEYTNRLLNHQRADEIIQGEYWENGRGCALGCTFNAKGMDEKNNSIYDTCETKLNVPACIAKVEECIFEHSTSFYAKTFPLRFLNSIPVGFDDWKSFYNAVSIFLYEKICNPTWYTDELYYLLVKTMNYHRGLPSDIKELKQLCSSISLDLFDNTYSLYRAIHLSIFDENLPLLISAIMSLMFEKNTFPHVPSYVFQYHKSYEDIGDYMIEWFNNYIKSVELEKQSLYDIKEKITCQI